MTNLVAGRYELVREIARGGMGRVVLAHDRVLDRPLAIKLILPHLPSTARVRFIEEAQVNGQLAHPNIVPVHELGSAGQSLFMAMKLVDGQDMKKFVASLAEGDADAPRRSLRRILRLFLKVCDAMGYAHQLGVIHRDLKPANIMLGKHDEVLVMDWGLARPLVETLTSPDVDIAPGSGESALQDLPTPAGASSQRGLESKGTVADATPPAIALGTGPASQSALPGATPFELRSGSGSGSKIRTQFRSGDHGEGLTQAGDVVGTPAYMAPEQARGEKLDPRADVYALGAILYELTTHKAPYSGGTVQIMAQLFQKISPPRPSEVAPHHEIPAAVESIIAKAMAHDREDRYPEAGALATDIEAYLDGRGVEAHTERPLEQMRRILARHKVAVAAALVSAAAILITTTAALLLVLREEGRLRRETTAADVATTAAQTSADLSARVAKAIQIASESDRRVAAFEPFARTNVRLFDGDDAADTGMWPWRDFGKASGGPTSILDAHEKLAADFDHATVSLKAQAEELDPAGAAELAPYVLKMSRARHRLDTALAQVLLARRPSLALEKADSLSIGAGAQLVRARAHLRLGHRLAALAALAQVDTWPTSPAGLAEAAHAFGLLLAETAPSRQEEAFTAAIEQSSDRAWLYLRRAESRAFQGRFSEAEADYERAIQMQPLDAWVHSSRLLHAMPPFTEKLYDHVRAVVQTFSPENDEIGIYEKRFRLWTKGSWKSAENFVARLEQSTPLRASRVGAELALLIRRFDDAKRYARLALEISPKDRVGLGALAYAQLETGDTEEADHLAQQGLDLFPEDGRLNRVRGLVLKARGQLRTALPFLELGARPAYDSEPWIELAECLAQLDTPEDWERGIEAARSGMRFDLVAVFHFHRDARPIPGDPRLHRVLGHLRTRQGSHAAAAMHYLRALSFTLRFQHSGYAMGDDALGIGSDRQDALHAGRAHEALGLVSESVHYYQQALADERVRDQAASHIQRITGRAPR